MEDGEWMAVDQSGRDMIPARPASVPDTCTHLDKVASLDHKVPGRFGEKVGCFIGETRCGTQGLR